MEKLFPLRSRENAHTHTHHIEDYVWVSMHPVASGCMLQVHAACGCGYFLGFSTSITRSKASFDTSESMLLNGDAISKSTEVMAAGYDQAV